MANLFAPEEQNKQLQKKKKTKFFARLKKKIVKKLLMFDYFAEPVELNFKGSKQLAALDGAIISTLMRVTIIFFVIISITSMFMRNEDTIYSVAARLPPEKVVNFGEANSYEFLIGFDKLFPESYGQISVQMETYRNGALVETQVVFITDCPDADPGV